MDGRKASSGGGAARVWSRGLPWVLLAGALVLGAGEAPRARAGEPPALPPALAAAERALGATVPADLPPVLVLAQLTTAQYAGAVSMAMEGMRVVMGELTDDEERRFEARWKPLFEHPSEDVIAYLNRLNPLLGQFLALRAAIEEAMETLDSSGLELLAAADMGDAAGVLRAMESARLYEALVASLEARLGLVAEAIRALGDPPNAVDLRRRARERHEAAFASAAPSMLEIVPAEVLTGPLRLVDFRAVVRGAPAGARLELDWRFSDGETRRTPPEKGVTRKFFLDPAQPEQGLDVALLDAGSSRVLARAHVKIVVRPPAGGWVLVERRVESDPSTKGARFRGSRMNPSTGLREPVSERPENVFDGRAEVRDAEATTGFGNLPKTEEAAFLHAWDPPPRRLRPRDAFETRVRVEGADATWKGGDESPEGLTLATWTLLPEPKAARDLGAAAARSRCATRRVAVEPAARLGAAAYAFVAPLPDAVGQGGKAPLEPTGQVLELRIRGRGTFFRCSPSFTVTYRYAWDPTGTGLRAFDEPGAGGGPAPATPGSEETEEQRRRRVAKEQAEFHETNARWFEAQAAAKERDLLAAVDPDARNLLARDLLYLRDAWQRERDAITSLSTGEFVRTRSDLDAFNMKVMAEESRRLAETWHTIRRVIERGPTLVEMAPPEDRERLRAFFYGHVTSEAIASGDPERLRKVSTALADRVLGGLEQDLARKEEAGVSEAEWTEWAENLKQGADASMMALSFLGGSSVYMVYQGATGYVEGGVLTAVERTASGYHALTTIAHAGIVGYQQGVLSQLDAYAANPGRVRLDEQQAGWTGAAWGAGEAAALMAVMHLGYATLGGGGLPTEGRLQPSRQRQDARERFFRARQAEGRAKVEVFRQKARTLAAAGKANAPRAELLRLRADLEGCYRDVKTDYFAKLRLNALGRAGDSKTLHAYASIDRTQMKRVTAALERRMTEAGFSGQRYRSFSNSASKGKAGMDVDIGAVEPPRTLVSGGTTVRNPEHLAWQRSIIQRLPDGRVVRRSPLELQEAGQRELEAAFEEVFARRPGEAMVAFTTTFHPEAYRDVKWLGKKGLKTALVHETDPAWTQQAADVTAFKVNHLPKEHPSLGYYGHLQEQCRGLVKDFDTKLAPMLPTTRNPEARRHLEELRGLMHGLATDALGPVEVDRRLRILTGGEGVSGVLDRFRIMLIGARGALPR